MRTEKREGYLEEDICIHIFTVSSAMVGVCLTVIGLIRVVITLALAVLAVAGGFAFLGRQLTILHVIGMLLIVAVGSNYALFFDRRAAEAHPGSVPLTLASLLVANVATVVSFGILAFSSVPVLAALGSTVAPGALLALVFSALLAWHLPEPTQPVVG